MSAFVELCTAVVFTVKVAVVAPWETTTVPGTVAADGLLLASAIDAPPDGAAAVNVAVPCTEEPPETDDEPSVTDCKAADDGGGLFVGLVLDPPH
jgi:hypothetical protein